LDTTLSIVVLAIIALVLGAAALWRRGVRRQALLMLLIAAIAAGNLALWLVPNDQGKTLVNAELGD
jgi:peptidoglycan/LPS O-acetylase OafA/YrhL